MRDITCFVGDLATPSAVPSIGSLQLDGRDAGAWLSAASGGQFRIDLDWRRRSAPTSSPVMGVTNEDLFQALDQLLPSAGAGAGIGLLLTDLYKATPAFGIMFDTAGESGLAAAPRIGCALFLSQIQASANWASDADFEAFVAYVAIHELGHAFNLWHADGSFMSASPDPRDFTARTFPDDQRRFLQQAGGPEGHFVLPGGSSFGDRGDLAPPDVDDSNQAAASPSSPLRLDVRLSRSTLWSFEPIELELRLSVVDGQTEAPADIDPGYPSFRIWLTNPRGERVRYRPLVRFCHSNGAIKVSPERPFVRDISIFTQSGGYTFREAGVYYVEAELLVASGWIRSNRTFCEVQVTRPDSPDWRDAAAALRERDAIRLLRSKSWLPPQSRYRELAEFAKAHAQSASAAAVHYALGRALNTHVAKSTDDDRKRWLAERARVHLQAAADHPGLGEHARALAIRYLDDTDSPRPPWEPP